MTNALLKPALVALLAFALFVPVGMIQSLVAERQARNAEAAAGIAHGWGGRQVLAGPYLAVPYEKASEHGMLRLPADAIEWRIGAEVSEKARGIYRARLYSAAAEVGGHITVPARFGLAEAGGRIKWGVPRLVLGVSDPQGIRSVSPLVIGDAQRLFEPGPGDGAVAGGVHVPLPELADGKARILEFSFSLGVAGSEALAVAPLGADTSVQLRSDWPHPSFAGRFLPARHEIGAGGFSAEWRVSRYAAPGVAAAHELAVGFIEPAGLYQRLERASKYGFLFIGLTFAAFLLFELARRLAIHPIQYLLVGLALAMFFLLLTALSEHIDFAAAYAIATLACVGLITSYLVRVLRSASAALAFGGALGAVYALLYALLKAEDYSLLGGTLLLFGLLAAVMLATRRMDWYALTENRSLSGARAS